MPSVDTETKRQAAREVIEILAEISTLLVHYKSPLPPASILHSSNYPPPLAPFFKANNQLKSEHPSRSQHALDLRIAD